MSTRVKLIVKNKTGLTVKCTDVRCEKFSDLKVGTTIAAGGENTFLTDTNDRIFCTFTEEAPGAGSWQLSMTCPKSSTNSACGSFNAGLQHYDKHGTPAVFTFILGEANLADWDNGSVNKGKTINYGDCS